MIDLVVKTDECHFSSLILSPLLLVFSPPLQLQAFSPAHTPRILSTLYHDTSLLEREVYWHNLQVRSTQKKINILDIGHR